jgi:hypothetical protein
MARDTQRLVQVKKMMETDLRELEVAIHYFTAPKVYVPKASGGVG